ncbi:MAG: hypothetical protein PVF75_02445 [Granulosicoccaceae bacterium]|jgi:hypothetical protein
MNSIHPVSEEFLYCDPECVHDWISPCQSEQPCYACCLPQQRGVIARPVKPARRVCREVQDEQ